MLTAATSRRRIGTFVAVAAAAVIVVGALCWPAWPAIAVDVDGRPAAGGSLPLAADEQFGISFVHSVDNLPVQDWYVIKEGQLVQDSSRLISFGAGMGHIAGRGTGHVGGNWADGKWWEVRDIDQPIGDLVIRVGRDSVDHRLRYPDGELALSECWPLERVTVRATKVATITRLLGSLSGPGCH